jgi:uncharacterized protein
VAGRTDIFDLGRLSLHSGEARRLQLDVGLDRLEIGGQEYSVRGGRVPVTLDVAHTTSGWSLRLRYLATLEGPCMRCLDPAERRLEIDSREVDQPRGGEDLRSPYVDGQDLNVRDWVHDALMLDLPSRVLCSDDCAGLCPICGENLNERPHEHEQRSDPRWAKLSELKLK